MGDGHHSCPQRILPTISQQAQPYTGKNLQFQSGNLGSSREQKGSITSTNAEGLSTAERSKSTKGNRVVVFGATGYIGRFVVKESIGRGYDTVAFAREQSGVGGKNNKADVEKDFKGAEVAFGSVMDDTVQSAFDGPKPVDTVVVCLASRTGGVQDSYDIDYAATKRVLDAARKNKVRHFVLLSAICVQKPTLAFQKAKLKFEEELQAATDITHSIVRPTAFFKSLAAQIEPCKAGGPYVMFGDGELASCKPISERDLAAYLINCVEDKSLENKILPIGGPGKALSAKEQGEILFKAIGKEPNMLSVPVGLFDAINGFLAFLASIFPALTDAAELDALESTMLSKACSCTTQRKASICPASLLQAMAMILWRDSIKKR